MKIDQSKYVNEFSRNNKIGRILWGFVSFLFFRFSPKQMHKWRIFLLKLLGAKIGQGCVVFPSTKIWAPWNLEMGDYTALGFDVDCYNMDKISIGSNVTVSQYSYLCTGSHDISHPHMKLIHKPIVIQDMAWVCAGVFISPGITVGEGSVIAAKSVVIKNVKPWSVVGGNPAKFIKERIVNDK